MVDIIFEAIEHYACIIIFGAVGILFFIYPFIEKRMTFNIKDIALYWTIGAFFAALAIAILVQNGVVIGVLLTSLFGALFLWLGVSTLYDVSRHNIEVKGILIKIKEISSFRRRRRIHYELTFNVPEKRAEYTVKYASPKRGYTVGKTFAVYIPENGNTAFIHRDLWSIVGIIELLFGGVWIALLLKILNII